MVKVHGRATSINVQKVMWTIGELGIAYERVDVGGPFGGLDTPDMVAMNPNRLIPVVEDEGVCIWESNAIVRHLSRKYGGGAIAPLEISAHANADMWMDWSITTLYRDIIATIFLGLIRTPAAERNQAAIDAAMTNAANNLAILDGVLANRQYVAGDAFTMADIAVGTLMYRYFNLEIARPPLPNVERWYNGLTQREPYATHVMLPFDAMKVPGA